MKFDGDRMGKWIRGEHVEVNYREYLQRFSEAIFNFSREVREIEKNTCARIVYAGGDDVLLFCPVEDVFKVARWVRGCFERNMQTIKGEMDDSPTISCGAVIFHHLYPLYSVLERVEDVLERTAKEELGRNAFAIEIIKERSTKEREENGKSLRYWKRPRNASARDFLRALYIICLKRKTWKMLKRHRKRSF